MGALIRILLSAFFGIGPYAFATMENSARAKKEKRSWFHVQPLLKNLNY